MNPGYNIRETYAFNSERTERAYRSGDARRTARTSVGSTHQSFRFTYTPSSQNELTHLAVNLGKSGTVSSDVIEGGSPKMPKSFSSNFFLFSFHFKIVDDLIKGGSCNHL